MPRKLKRKGFIDRCRGEVRESWRRRRGVVAAMVFGGLTLLLVLTAIFGEHGLFKVRQLERNRNHLESRIADLEDETARLSEQVREFKSGDFPYERDARERLGLVKPGEVVYDFRTNPLKKEE